MEENQKKKKLRSIKGLMLGYVTTFVVSLLVILGCAVGLALYAASHPEKESYLIEITVLSIAFVVIALALIITNIRIYSLCYKRLYFTSKSLIENISLNKQNFDRFPKKKIAEFEDLNIAIDKTEKHLQRSVVYSRSLNYDSLNLEYSDQKLGTIEYESFVKNIPEIIMLSQAFRNAFVHITYGERLSELVGQSSLEIIKHIRRLFDYDNILVTDDSERTGYIVYIPQIDSLNRLKEEVEMFIKNASMVKNTPNGKALVASRISVVIYPFSDVSDIIADLRYANRQGLNVNFYFPERLNKSDTETVMHGSFSLNRSNQLIANLASLRLNDKGNKELKETIRKQLETFSQFIDADYAGAIMRDERTNKFSNYVAITNREESFQTEGEIVAPEIINSVVNVMDVDGSYYFSTRAHLSPELGAHLDKYGITSGHIFVVSDSNGPLGLIYFFNYQKSMSLDSYLRESALSISLQIGAVIRENNQDARLRSSEVRSDMLMKLSNYMLYAVDKNTHEIVYASDTFVDQFGQPKKKACYRAIYGADEPCEDCPLHSQSKMLKVHRNIKYETSPAMNSDVDDIGRLLVKRVEKTSSSSDRFDRDFLINSYASLVEDLENSYLIQARGYVLLLTIENYKKILEVYGSEGYLKYVRGFIDSLNEKFDKEYKFYVFDNSKIAMVIPETGRTEIVDLSEKIYEASKTQFVELNEDQEFIPLEMNYISLKYPQEYPTHTDLLRAVQTAVATYDHKKHVDQIFFYGTDYYRCASRTQFINEVIDKSFKEKTFKVNLQPMLSSVNKHIVGAEILIRLSDDYRNQALSAYEVIKVAGEQHKIGIISDALIEYIGTLYEQQGNGLFKSHQFTRLSLNTDYSYFSEDNFLSNINSMLEKYEFPREFLSFEINENELAGHYDEFKPIIAKLKQIGVHLAVDQYTGKFISLDKVRSIGIPEVKIPRNMVKDIDVNKTSLTALQELVKTADEYSLRVAVVGVENKDQYMLIRDMTKESLMQGYYFFEPLELNQMIEAIKVN